MDLIWAVKDERKESFLCSGIVYTMTIVGVPKKKREKKTCQRRRERRKHTMANIPQYSKRSPLYLSSQFFLKLDIFVRLFDFFHNLLEGHSNLPSNSKNILDSITNKNNHNL